MKKVKKKREPYLYYAKPIHCTECNRQITKGGKRKHPQPDWDCEMCCHLCSLKNPLERAFRKLNERMDDAERAALNDFREKLFTLCKEGEEKRCIPAQFRLIMSELVKFSFNEGIELREDGETTTSCRYENKKV